MTGMVKEVILVRQAELGFTVENGRLVFDRLLLDPQELLPTPSVFSYLDVHGRQQQIVLEAGSLAYTICQTPVVLEIADETGIIVNFSNGTHQRIKGTTLDAENSRHVFLRDGDVRDLIVTFPIPWRGGKASAH